MLCIMQSELSACAVCSETSPSVPPEATSQHFVDGSSPGALHAKLDDPELRVPSGTAEFNAGINCKPPSSKPPAARPIRLTAVAAAATRSAQRGRRGCSDYWRWGA